MIRFASDLHLEFYEDKVDKYGINFIEELINKIFTPLSTDKETILVLPGDIILIKQLDKFKYFFENISNQFKSVIWVFGNHEWFKSTINEKTIHMVKDKLSHIKNLHILNNEIFEDEKYYFIGSTLWSDINKGDYLTALDVVAVSYDYKKIKFQEGHNYSKLRPRNVSKMFIDNSDFIKNSLLKAKEINKKKVVVTHHPPSIKAIPDFLKDNADFWSDFGNFNFDYLLEHEILPDLWIHGHIHKSQKFEIYGTDILSNTRGYDDVDSNGKSFIDDNFSNNLVLS